MKKKIYWVLNHPLFSGSAILVGGSMVANIVNYFYHLLMGRMLGPVDYGVLSSLYALLYVVSIIPTSTSLSIVKFISSAKSVKEQAVIYHNVNKFILKVSFIGGAIILLLSPFIANFLQVDSVFEVALVAPVFLFSLLILVNQATAQGMLDFFTAVLPLFAMSIGKLVIGIVLVFLGFAVGGAMVGVVLSMIFGYLLSKRAARKFSELKQNKRYDLGPFFKYSAPVLLQAMAFTSIISMDVILVKHFFNPELAGYYAAMSTLGKIIFFAAQPVSTAVFPIISKRVSLGEKYLKVFFAAFGATVAIAAIVVLGYALLPNLAIGATFGGKFLSGNNYLVWMGLFFGFYSVSYLLVSFFLSINKTKIVILPLVASVLQIVIIWMAHADILQVIQISLSLMVILCISLSTYFVSLLAKKGLI